MTTKEILKTIKASLADLTLPKQADLLDELIQELTDLREGLDEDAIIRANREGGGR